MQTQAQTQSYNRFTAGRYLMAMAIGGDARGAAALVQSQRWTDARILLAAIDPATTESGDSTIARQPVADSFLAAMRPFSIPLQLDGLKRVPPNTRLFVSDTGVVVGETTEAQAISVVRGTWSTQALRLRKFAGISIVTRELVESLEPTASAAITDDLASATAIAENRAFLDPDLLGSVLYGAPAIVASGTNAAAAKTDIRSLLAAVPAKGGVGHVFVTDELTAVDIHLRSPSEFPNIGATGGSLMGIPVLIADSTDTNESPNTRILALLNASRIYWADRGRVRLEAAMQGSIQMDDAPSGAAQQTSMFQTNSVALRAIRESGWYAAAGAGAYMRVSG